MSRHHGCSPRVGNYMGCLQLIRISIYFDLERCSDLGFWRCSRAHELNVLIQRLPLDSDIEDLMIEAM